MTIDDFLELTENKAPLAAADKVSHTEEALGVALSDDYRSFLGAPPKNCRNQETVQ